MTPAGWFFVFLVLVVPAFLILEGRRQRRRVDAERSGTKLARAGLLEMQNLLEPERKVEVFREEPSEAEADESGAPPTPEERARRRVEESQRPK